MRNTSRGLPLDCTVGTIGYRLQLRGLIRQNFCGSGFEVDD